MTISESSGSEGFWRQVAKAFSRLINYLSERPQKIWDTVLTSSGSFVE